MSTPQLIISELFHSIQGESSFAGYPCCFIRLSGCNLRCSYCDASYTYEEQGQAMELAAIMEFVASYPASMVQITGGEPLLQEGVYPLMAQLLASKRLVLLETNGSIDLAKVPAAIIKIMDIKCPDSGMADKMLLTNLEHLTPADELKFVLSSRNDYEWAVDFSKSHGLLAPDQQGQQEKTALLFSPVANRLEARQLAEWLLADQLPIRLQIQLHTILWPQVKRGV